MRPIISRTSVSAKTSFPHLCGRRPPLPGRDQDGRFEGLWPARNISRVHTIKARDELYDATGILASEIHASPADNRQSQSLNRRNRVHASAGGENILKYAGSDSERGECVHTSSAVIGGGMMFSPSRWNQVVMRAFLPSASIVSLTSWLSSL